MAKCPNCGQSPTIRELLEISRRRPYVCPCCKARSTFRTSEEAASGLVSVVLAGACAGVLGSGLSPWARFGLTLGLVLAAITVCRMCLRLYPGDPGA